MSNLEPRDFRLKPRSASEVDVSVGKRLRARREMLGMSQQDLADRCHISPQQVHKYETGISSIRASRIVQFGYVLDVPSAYFLDGVGFVSSYPDDMIELFSDRMTAEIVRLLSKMDDETVKRGMLEMARAYHAVRFESDDGEGDDLSGRASG
ncbi:MAG: helix-turn-helix transcriptional regulator [Pseudomonadota bacterium]